MSADIQSYLSNHIEDALPYAVPLAVALAGFNWASLIPGDNNPFLVATAFGFLAKFLIGLQQNGLTHYEDLIPTLTISLGFLATALSSNNDPTFLAYGTGIGFVVKALGTFQKHTDGTYGNPIEDLLLFIGGLLIAYGTSTGHPVLASAGSLLALVGKTAPSLSTTST